MPYLRQCSLDVRNVLCVQRPHAVQPPRDLIDVDTNPEKTKNPEMLTLDSTYRIGNRSFIVEPVFKEESSQTLGEVLLRLMKSESEKL